MKKRYFYLTFLFALIFCISCGDESSSDNAPLNDGDETQQISDSDAASPDGEAADIESDKETPDDDGNSDDSETTGDDTDSNPSQDDSDPAPQKNYDSIEGVWKKATDINLEKNECGKFYIADMDFGFNHIELTEPEKLLYINCKDDKCEEKDFQKFYLPYDSESMTAHTHVEDPVSTGRECTIDFVKDLKIIFSSFSKAKFEWTWNLTYTGAGCEEVKDKDMVEGDKCAVKASVELVRP